MDPVVEVRALTKIYRRRLRRQETLKGALVGFLKGRRTPHFAPPERALEDVSFTVGPGKTFAVLGANGSGKSTLLKILAGILRPTSGEVVVRGKVAALLELGAGFHPEISGRENVILNGIMLGLTRREVERKLPEIIAFAELEDAIDEPVKVYSSGMYVRLGFAVATAVDPEVLLVDEVLAVGDEAFSHKCRERFEDFRRRGKTIVLVTHALELAAELADEACWIDGGRLRACGYPREVIDAYRSQVQAQEDARLSGETPAPVRTPEPVAEAAPAPDPRAPRRWGDGLVRIESVRLVDARGEERHVLTTGEAVTLEMHLEAKQRIEDFVLGVAIFAEGGLCVYGTNTDLEGFAPRSLAGKARVRVAFPAVELLEGRYAVDVAVHRKAGAAYDYRLGALSFRMSAAMKDVGIARLPHTWSVEGGIVLERARS